VEAPTIGSIILAGLLLKIGTFGMLRFMFPFLNFAATYMQPLIFTVAVVSVYHASLIAVRQFDLKKTIAYSSVAHMGFVVLGLFSFNIYGFLGSVFIMFSHGIVASSLFFLIGIIYERYKSRNILEYGGFAQLMPIYAIFFFLFTLTNLSFPGTSNFVGEFVTLIGVTETNYFVSMFATLSIILTSIYSI
jgi:NADH-quinone oxidoreductase subunit M